jgi:hypothetical protein
MKGVREFIKRRSEVIRYNEVVEFLPFLISGRLTRKASERWISVIRITRFFTVRPLFILHASIISAPGLINVKSRRWVMQATKDKDDLSVARLRR